MTKSLADLRKEKDQPASLPTRIVKACLDQSLLADVQRLTAEKTDLLTQANISTASSETDGQNAAPKKMGEGGTPPRVDEIDAELLELYQRLRNTEGEILLRATDGGAWLRWKDAHPPREDNESDQRYAWGLCNATDLLNDLAKYAVSWNGEDFGPGEWDGWFSGKVAPADLAECVSNVVEMHESRFNAPKSQSTSSEPRTKLHDSGSPEA